MLSSFDELPSNPKSSAGFQLATGLRLIIGGIVGFLPVFGIWMVPLGALLLA